MLPRKARRATRALALLALLVTAMPATADAAFGDRTLKVGSRGKDVRVLQSYLTRVGIRTTVDGVYGRGTATRVKRFERRESLRVDGRVQPADARRLRARVRAAGTGESSSSGGTEPGSTSNTSSRARLSSDGRTAIAPDDAPEAVKQMVAAANRITRKPYRYGGGHGSFEDSGYDCSGAVSYALHGAGLIDRPMDSRQLMSWGLAGRGQWVTVYAHSGHAYVVIAGLRFDTSGAGEEGPRWRTESRSSSGYTARHPRGL